mgnify:FL=1
MDRNVNRGGRPRVLVPIEWRDDVEAVRIIDQTLLPEELRYVDVVTVDQMCEAISKLRVRGAPAIGVAAPPW